MILKNGFSNVNSDTAIVPRDASPRFPSPPQDIKATAARTARAEPKTPFIQPLYGNPLFLSTLMHPAKRQTHARVCLRLNPATDSPS